MSEPQIVGYNLVAPSTVTTGEEFALKIKALCEPYDVGARAFQGYPRLAGPFNISPRGIRYLDNAAPRRAGSARSEHI